MKLTSVFMLLGCLVMVATTAAGDSLPDPTLVYGTFCSGGGADEYPGAVALDADGNIIIAGYTKSPDLPLLNAFDTTFEGFTEGFLAKISHSGELVFCTYFGGAESDYVYDMVVDEDGYIYVCGMTYSPDLPMVNSYDSTRDPSSSDAFIAKFQPDGVAIVYSTYLGGSSTEYYAAGIAIDSSRRMYIVGTTLSSDFPMVKPVYSTSSGYHEIFVAKLSAEGDSLLFSTYLGAVNPNGEFEFGLDIGVDAGQNIVITGVTEGDDFPVVNAADPIHNGWRDICVTRFVFHPDMGNGELYSTGYSTYLGGSLDEDWSSIAVDAAGNAYVTGLSESEDYPIHNAYEPTRQGFGSGVMTKLSPTGVILNSTYFGGGGWDRCKDITVDGDGRVMITGSTSSSTFPMVNPIDSVYRASYMVFVAMFSPDYQGLEFSTYLGGRRTSGSSGIALGPDGQLGVVGTTRSPDFPIVNGFQTVLPDSTYNSTFVAVIANGCCNHDGMRGDVNGGGSLNVSDVSYLVDFLFRGGVAPPCEAEGDVNGSGGINVSDLSVLVDYLFRGGADPAACQ